MANNASLTNTLHAPPCYLKSYHVAFLDLYLKITHSIVAPMNALAFLSATTLNLLILLAVIKDARIRTPSTLLLCSIVLKDLLIVSILQPVAVFRSSTYLLSSNFCAKTAADKIRPFLVFLYRSASLTIWVLISGDRWMAIRRAATYRRILTKKRAYIAIALAWVFSIALSYTATWGVQKKARYFLVFVQFGLTSVVISAIQISIYLSIKSHGNSIGAMSSTNRRQAAIEKRLAGTVAYSVIALAVIYIPVISMSIIRYQGRNLFLLSSPWMEMLLLSNAAINPIIWLKTSRQLRSVVGRIVRLPPHWLGEESLASSNRGNTASTVVPSSAVSNEVTITFQSNWKITRSPTRAVPHGRGSRLPPLPHTSQIPTT